MSAGPSPDCRAEKHHACHGDTWDFTLDKLAACPCTCHTPEPTP